MHILLLLSVLLPFVGSVLVVWARSIATVGPMAPFHGDHALHRIIFFICMVESTDTEIPGTRKRFVTSHSPEGFVTHFVLSVDSALAFMSCMPLYILSAFAFGLGPRFSYGVYMMANLAMTSMWCRVVVLRWSRVGPGK